MQNILEWANAMTNLLTAGTYPIRPVLFLAYLCAILLVWLLLKFLSKHRKPFFSGAHFLKITSLIAFSSVSALFVLNIILQVTTFSHFGIPQWNAAVMIKDGEITTTRFTHNHFGKVVIASALEAPTRSLVLQADTGRALVPYVPKVAIYFEILIFVIALLTSVLAAASYLLTQRKIIPWISALILQSVLGFLVLEKSLDGGLFSDGAGFALLTWGTFLLLPVSRFTRFFPYLVFGYVSLLAGLYVFGFYWPPLNLVLALERTAFLFVIVVVCVFGMFGKRSLVAIGAVLILISALVLLHINGATDRMYLDTTITPGSQYLSVYPEELQPSLPHVGSIGDLQVYDLSSRAPTSIKELLSEYHLLPAYRPITSGTFECANPKVLKEQKFDVVTPSPLTSVVSKDGLYSFTVTRIYPVPTGWFHYYGVLLYTPCVTRYLDVLEQGILLAGSRTAVVYGLELYTTPNRLTTQRGDN